MYKLSHLLFLLCETPLHAGTGSDLGIVDLPIQRERHTGFPKIEASGLKGSLKQSFRDRIGQNSITKERIALVFGQEDDLKAPEADESYMSALGITDARLLLFPVRSVKGVFAWITCPAVLNRFQAEMKLAKQPLLFDMPEAGTTTSNSTLFVKGNSVVLEEYRFDDIKASEACDFLAEWLSEHVVSEPYWKEKMKKDILILSDDDFRDFVQLSTEVITRTNIDPNTGTVKPGALFTEEYLPMETILYTLIMASPVFSKSKHGFDNEQDVMNFFEEGLPDVLQIGGSATIGKGLVRTQLVKGAK
ncbi:type III-B CRISPR module RAMP protein Cmr4 [Aneurinibacillus sp. UBA3580]|uniref:type III-B CRISPR module RAMP protein Cmr4 n=1 Tax=Aneurinibacillus sp. UBA3580 TaxID=1946041 RepID=UPI00257D3AC3|nr:type III-B CRISPR module RAMP protein Cmr4 [Aneurinibacillus sp. UBA3580]